MPPLTRTPLASVVCPSAPFLAPRLLRPTVAVAVAARQSQQQPISSTPRCYANPANGKKSGRSYFLEMRKREQQQARRRARGDKDSSDVSPEVIELALALQQACERRNLQQLMDLYPAALDAGIFDRRATHILCQALHASVRRDAARKSASRLPELLPFVGQVVSDLRKGALPPHPFAYVHLLGIYKDAKRFTDGHALWLWLAEQDDAHVSQAAYGAAIELLSYGNLMSLPELEQLYDEGLKRFPGTYAEYHLSPDAIVPDRAQPVHIVGLPTTLLQGIVTARLRSHDWKKAYLGLDTVLRLYPGQTPHRIFELFITERPLSEAYTAYLLACRSGVQTSGGQVTNLLNRLRVAMTQSRSLRGRFKILRAMANALYAYQQCGGGLASVHVGQFIKAFEFMLPDKAPGQEFTEEEEAVLRNTLAVTAHECLASLIQSGLSPEVHPFVSLVSLAGKLRAPDLLKSALQDAKTAGITFGPVERRTLLTAAGLIKDRDLVKALWSLIVTGAESEGTQLSYNDWITFAKACRRAESTRHFEQQLQELAHTITASIEKRVRSEADNLEPEAAKSSVVLMAPEQLNSEIQTLQGQLENTRAVLMSGQPLNLQHSPFYMHIDPEQPSLGTEEDLRAVYDELTTDPHQPAAPASGGGDDDSQAKTTASALSKTGIPLDELRFRNWVNVHEMMSAASAYAASRRDIIDKAIAQRKSPKDIPELLFLPEIKPAQTRADLRNRVKELRAPDSIFRRVSGQIKPGTYFFAKKFERKAQEPEADTTKIHKHITNPFTVRKSETQTPDEVFEPKTLDPSTSRWHTRKVTKTYSDAKYDAAEVKSRFEAYADSNPMTEAAGEPKAKSETPVAKTADNDAVPWMPS
ncbi:hypothetical protein BU25DRAFT_488115 [Macroventuria anomochaeta]|uniref:Uncharacterized protein n=1 Tax=Macroventuria anomochaeta TaxID=301207 RepID=A0ACB6SBK3_9PLEO|nr:uncharacterized protein BU25DRAFT_488115 [Macroventuria anomochaeta]KAF2631526.1 hypothetical protein BU25DRAFT_488115 [Macroventuria anomochaeta]